MRAHHILLFLFAVPLRILIDLQNRIKFSLAQLHLLLSENLRFFELHPLLPLLLVIF